MNKLFSKFFAWKHAPYALVFLCACAATAAYLQVLHAPFVLDDTIYISSNKKLAGLNLLELWRLFTEPYNGMGEFLPLRELTYWFDMSLFGLNPAAFRIHNIFLYWLCLPLIYAVTARSWRHLRPLDAADAPWVAATVTALFALHPSHAEAVVWIAGRKDVLSGLLSLLALWLALAAKREHGFCARYAVAALAALLAALLSKAFAIAMAVIIAMIWLLFWWDMAEPKKYRLLLWPFAALILAACVVSTFAASTSAVLPFYFGMEAVTRSLSVLGWLARLAASPENRHFFYPVFDDTYLPIMVAAGVAVLAVVATGAMLLLRKRSFIGLATIVFLLLCMPALQLLPYKQPSVVSDRYIFLAVWPATMIIVALLWRLKPLPRALFLLGLALSWLFQTAERTRDWRSTEAMIEVDVRAFPGYYVPAVYKIMGQLPRGEHDKAMETANSITSPGVRNIIIKTIGADHAVQTAIRTGMPQEAMDSLWPLGAELKNPVDEEKWNSHMANVRVARRVLIKTAWNNLTGNFPDNASVRYNAGLWMLDMLDIDAVANLRAAVESQGLAQSMRGTALKNYGLALLYSGQMAKAEAPLRSALEQIPPDYRAYCALATVYRQTGRAAEALQADANCRNPSRSQ